MGFILALIFVTLVSGNVVNSTNIKKYKMPASCKNQTYCTEKGQDYPSDAVLKKALQNSNLRQIVPTEPAISDRIGDEGCSADYENATIYYIRDADNIELVYPVIQLEKHFAQTHELHQCSKGLGCKNANQEIMATISVKLVCNDQFLPAEFFVLDGRGEVQSKQGDIPVCCKCTYEPPMKTLF